MVLAMLLTAFGLMPNKLHIQSAWPVFKYAMASLCSLGEGSPAPWASLMALINTAAHSCRSGV